MSKENVSGGGTGFTGLLTIVFIVLKLTHMIDWSWWWVLSPIWILVALILLILLVAFLIGVISERRRYGKY